MMRSGEMICGRGSNVFSVQKAAAAFFVCAILALGAFGETAPMLRKYTPATVFESVAYSYACPTLFDWNGDGLLDLVVGEKTSDCKGKIRLYLNRGTATAPAFIDYSFIQKNGKDIEFAAKGCVGVQVGFGRAQNATMFLAISRGKIYGWEHSARNPHTNEQPDWTLWFDHSTDSRFSELIRVCTFCTDLDGDGYDEVVVSGQKSPIFWMKRDGVGDGARTVCTPLVDATGAALKYPNGQSHASAVVLDVTGDGVNDLVTGDTMGNVWVYIAQRDGRFSSDPLLLYVNMNMSNHRSRLAVGDLDGDGILDILVGRENGSVLMLKGEPDFTPVAAPKHAD